jgi:eukaryotic-like serine/threonine-protein kinase
MSELDQRAKEIFEVALKLPPKERAAHLDQACRGDDQLHQRIIDALFKAAQKTGAGPKQPPASPPQDTVAIPFVPEPPGEKPGDRIGRYKLLEQIGEGGMGTVWVAEQREPVRRKVALKIIKLGMDTRQVIARFEAGRQALALMDHPNIAKVLDAGATDTGRPYFAMEFVSGEPITTYCDRQNLTTDERLGLFVQVCRAIQHAHQKGIIHRDIKPSNILVALQDGAPVPKVIDFGIAKATAGQQLTDKTLYTAMEQFVGTPAYMSPEQAEMAGVDIDTRSDIYSLGVMLYELLTSKMPFDPKRLLQAGLDEIRRIIREEEPARPSTRIGTLEAAEQTTVAKRRQSEPPKLVHQVRGDLDWIVMKCLEKDRTRRYETANGLAVDIQRHLNDEMVVARPPSQLYRFRKLVRRNRGVFLGTAAVVTVLILGFAGSAWQAVRATRAEREKASLLEMARKAQAAEAAERLVAQQRLYDSLVREARATRIARGVGYREQAFSLLRQAQALQVPQKDVPGLRWEALACLGDFVGFTPTTWRGFPTNVTIRHTLISPTGRVACFPLSDGTILLRALPNGDPTARLRHQYPAESVCYNANGDQLVSVHIPPMQTAAKGLEHSVICRWTQDPVDGKWKAAVDPVPGAFACLKGEPQPLLAVQDSGSTMLQLLDSESHRVVAHTPQQAAASVVAVGLSPNGEWLAMAEKTVSNLNVLHLWAVKTGERIRQLDPGLVGVFDVTFSADSKLVAWLSNSGCAIYATDGLKPLVHLAEFFNYISHCSFGSGDTIALPFYQQNRLRLWDALRNQDFAVLELPASPFQTAFAPDNSLLLVSGLRQAWLFQLNAASEKLDLPGHVGGACGACFSPDGAQVASVAKDRTVRVRDAATGRPIWSGPLPDLGQAVCYSADGRLLLTACINSRLIDIWDAQTGTRLLELGTHRTDIVMWSVQFTPDKGRLITVSSDGITVWSVEPATPTDSGVGLVGSVKQHLPGWYWGLALAPNAPLLATFDYWGKLVLWDLEKADAARTVTTDVLPGVQNVCFTPDGSALVFVDNRRSIVTFDLKTWKKKASFPAVEADRVGGWATEPNLCLSPDGTKLALASYSRLGIDIWDMQTGRLLSRLPEGTATVYWLAWSPESQRLAVSRSNGDIAIWNLPALESALAGLGLSQ